MRRCILAVFLVSVATWGLGQTVSPSSPLANAVRITNGPVVEYADDSLAVIYWTTNLPATSTVHFGTNPQTLDHVAAGATAQTQHRVNVADLSPSTKYYFIVESADPSGNGVPAHSRAETLTTVAAGQPAIQNHQASSTSTPAAAGAGTTASIPSTSSGVSNSTANPQPGSPTAHPAPVSTTSAQPSSAPQPAASPSTQPAPRSQELPAGTQIQAALDQKLSTTTSQPGDNFSATVSQPVRAKNGAVLIPVGSKINGQVSESEQGKTLPAIRGRGRLNVRFIDITFPEHVSAPLMATLVSVHPKGGNGKAGSEGEITSGTSGKNTAKDVGIGAGVGTLAGLIFGSALKGLAIGAIAGGGYVLATDGKDVDLPAQTDLTVRLDQNLVVPVNVMQQDAQSASPSRPPTSH